jgi:hypothetical protein
MPVTQHAIRTSSEAAMPRRAQRMRFALVVPHTVAATASVKFGQEHSGQRDFVKLRARGEIIESTGP